MTRQRRYSILAVAALIAAVVVGAASWFVGGDAFWVVCGVAVVLVVAGIYLAGRASASQEKTDDRSR